MNKKYIKLVAIDIAIAIIVVILYSPGLLALRFHKTVSRLVLEMCRLLRKAGGLHEVALSGGVFANRLLLDDVLAILRKDGFRVYINRQVPPGDGGISLGQAYLCRHRENLPHKEA